MSFVLTLIFVAVALLSPAVLPDGAAELHLMDILAVLVLLTGIGDFGESELGSLSDTYIILGLILSCCVSTIATGWIGGVPITLEMILPQVFGFYFVVLTCRSLKRLRILVFIMTLVCLYILVQGLLADAANNELSPWIFMEGALRRFRGLGFLNDPNDLAQFCAMLFPLLFLRWKKGAFAGNLLFTLLPASCVVLLIYNTHSRGATLALLAILLFTFKDKIGLVLSSVLAAVASAGMVALNMSGGRGINEDDGGRVELWGEGLHLFQTHPLFGVGIGNFSALSSTGLTAHNSYVLSFAEIGLLGTMFWLAALTFAWSSLTDIIAGSAGAPAAEKDGVPAAGEMAGLASAAPAPFEAAHPAPSGMPAWMALRSGVPSGVSAAAHGYLPVGMTAAAATQPAFGTPFAPDTRFSGEFGVPPDDDAASDADLRHYARVIRTAMIGFLVTAFFLSRTFIMVLYILLGMAAALRVIYRKRHPEYRVDVKALVKRTSIILCGALVFIYVFIRIKGVH